VNVGMSSTFSPPLIRDFVGINGHTVQFKPELYRPVCGLVRDYHPVEWDLGTDTAELPPFPFARNGVDWSSVYSSWTKKDWRISVSLMFETVNRTNWTELARDARAYAKAFALNFGPSGSRKLVETVEIGNEPGKWTDADYRIALQAMAEGIREGDPKLEIATCNLTTGRSGDYEKSIQCLKNLSGSYDVLNVHTYAQLEGWPTWKRSYPEDPRLPRYRQDVDELCAWRDANAPGKPVWITEFGYDSSTKPPASEGDFSQWVGVTDQQQAQWLVRSVLVFSAMPVERAYVYFFNDEEQPSVHASSGITRNFRPKPSFHALAQLQRLLGDYRFTRVVTNVPGGLRVQEYGNDLGGRVWIVWLQSGEDKSLTVTLERVPGDLLCAQRMALGLNADTSVATRECSGAIHLQAEESPVYLVFGKDPER
jgi:hypothetical protein